MPDRRPTQSSGSGPGDAMMQALGATLAIVVALKVLTGLAFAPLAVIAFVVWIVAFGLSIRLKRIPRPR